MASDAVFRQLTGVKFRSCPGTYLQGAEHPSDHGATTHAWKHVRCAPWTPVSRAAEHGLSVTRPRCRLRRATPISAPYVATGIVGRGDQLELRGGRRVLLRGSTSAALRFPDNLTSF